MNNNNELYHHGVKGQRWGVRRYQNYDGTLKEGARIKLRRDEYDEYVQSQLNGTKNKNKASKLLREESRRIQEEMIAKQKKESRSRVAGAGTYLASYIAAGAGVVANVISGPVGAAILGGGLVTMLANSGRSVISTQNAIERANKNNNVLAKYYDEYNIDNEAKRIVNL